MQLLQLLLALGPAIPPTVVGPCPNPELRPFFEFHKKLTQSPKGFVDLTEDILGDKGRVEEKKKLVAR